MTKSKFTQASSVSMNTVIELITNRDISVLSGKKYICINIYRQLMTVVRGTDVVQKLGTKVMINW